jgi:hypothetical protein
LNNFIRQPKSGEYLARQLEHESDPDKICALSKVLIAAIDAQVGASAKEASAFSATGQQTKKIQRFLAAFFTGACDAAQSRKSLKRQNAPE